MQYLLKTESRECGTGDRIKIPFQIGHSALRKVELGFALASLLYSKRLLKRCLVVNPALYWHNSFRLLSSQCPAMLDEFSEMIPNMHHFAATYAVTEC